MRIDFTHRNYPSLIVAGLGTIGQGILRLGAQILSFFDQIVLADLDEERCRKQAKCSGWTVLPGSITDEEFLTKLIGAVRPPALFVNVCNSIDTVKLRRFLACREVGYIDICASVLDNESQSRFSRLMPYTNTSCSGQYPHLICQGINPGLVEYAARRLMRTFPERDGPFSISIYENDQLYSSSLDRKTAVGWCPADLVEEVMVSPSMEIIDGEIWEDSCPGTRELRICWDHRPYPARLVGHEDIWNLGRIDNVDSARFLYTLHAEVMNAFHRNIQEAAQQLTLPDGDTAIQGTEMILVKVTSQKTRQQKALLWQGNHGDLQRQYRMNAVQYQTSLGSLFAMVLMQHTEIGQLEGTYNASTLPLSNGRLEALVLLMQILGIQWIPVVPNRVFCKEG